jgi:hypothetical protein
VGDGAQFQDDVLFFHPEWVGMRLMPQPPMAVYSGSWKRVHIQAHIAAPVFLSPDEGLHQLN